MWRRLHYVNHSHYITFLLKVWMKYFSSILEIINYSSVPHFKVQGNHDVEWQSFRTSYVNMTARLNNRGEGFSMKMTDGQQFNTLWLVIAGSFHCSLFKWLKLFNHWRCHSWTACTSNLVPLGEISQFLLEVDFMEDHNAIEYLDYQSKICELKDSLSDNEL